MIRSETQRQLGVTTSAKEGEGWFPVLLRATVHALGAAVYTFPLAVSPVVLAAAVGSASGAVAAHFVARTRARLFVLTLGGLVALFCVVGAGKLLVTGDLLAHALGPAAGVRAGDTFVFGLGAFFVSLGMRTLATRRPVLAVLEAAFIAMSIATLVMAHRQGAINRPFTIADPVLARGGDPSVAILAVGVAAAAALVLLLLSERNALRALLHLVVIAAILALILTTARRLGMPEPPKTGAGLGLRDDDSHGAGGANGRPRDDLQFRDDYGSSTNQVPVAVVLLHDDYSPPTGTYYFRQSAFSHYNGTRLVATTRDDADRDLAPAFAMQRYDVEDAPLEGVFRAHVGTTVALLADHSRPFGLEAPVTFIPTTNRDPGRFRRVYDVESAALTADAAFLLGRDAGSRAWSPELLHYYTEAPADPRYRALADEIVARLPIDLRDDPYARALAVTEWLGHVGTYSLRSHHAQAADPTADFLFGDRTGYCVHFAHATAFLLRTLGLPARVATGYAVDESTRQGGSAILLTGGMSHAWPEVYLAGVGWIVTDVAPEHVVDRPPPPPDPDLQRLLGEMARGETPLPLDGSPPPLPILQTLRTVTRHAGRWGSWIVVSLLLGLYLAKAGRRGSPWVASDRRLARVAYRATLDRLSDVGVRRERGESREAFARRTGLPSFVALTRWHVAPVFGGARASRKELLALVRDVRRELAARTPLRRRLAGALVPWSFFGSR